MTALPRPRRKPKSAYHHGDLRTALIAAARREIERQGVETVNLKALAIGLGVSQPAPYRHFADREALLMAVAAEGFRAFCAALRPTANDLDAMADAYVGFAREHIGLYRLMFVSHLVPSAPKESELAAAADEAYALLIGVVSRSVRPGSAREVAVGFWASLHGLVLLAAEGFLANSAGSMVDPRLVRAVCEATRARCG